MVDEWQEWFEAHGRALLLFARQYTSCPADAEDAVQCGFIKFWPKRHGVRDARAYLYSAVRTAALDGHRATRRRARREAVAGLVDEAAWFQCPAEQAERAAAVETALTALPVAQREVVVMKIWGGLTFKQVGAALGISANTAASRYRYGLDALREQLAWEDQP